ncbi:ubiquinol-cytochrome c reductase iron-sulfur subunit [Planctomicrobium sp. SH668]|uniref:ubiquinol-cytochrome c reductase iron-sulfur subunit n=1 Tax=Planctomicrobium sp. SH668 TaxID=3448126 RepID=UPI003F5C82D6
MSDAPPVQESSEVPAEVVRRKFIVEAAAVVVGAFTAIVPAFTAIGYFLTPLLRGKAKAAEGDDGFLKIGSVNSLRNEGEPSFFQVSGIKQDAWTTYPSTSLGAVYVRKDENGKLTCFNARCTHLGCTVTYRPDKEDFLCPCHASSFSIDGQRSNQIPPRDLDHLECEIRNNDELWVKFQNFRAGREAKIPV